MLKLFHIAPVVSITTLALAASDADSATPAFLAETCEPNFYYVAKQACAEYECEPVEYEETYSGTSPDCGGCTIGITVETSCPGDSGTIFGTMVSECKVCE